jgi:hypothetical protein
MKKYILSIHFLFLISCNNDSFDFSIKDQLAEMKGEPAIFYINNLPYSSKKFREYILFKNLYLNNSLSPITPSEVEKELNEYIEDVIILNNISGDIDFNSEEFENYTNYYIRKAVISYYLKKKSGLIDSLSADYESQIDEELVNKFYEKNKENFRKLNKEESKKRIRNTIIKLKFDNKLESSKLKENSIIGQLKKENKVRIISKEVYKP